MLLKFLRLRKKWRSRALKKDKISRETSLSKDEKVAKTENEERMGIDASVS